MTLGRWFQNEVAEKFSTLTKKLDEAIEKWAKGQIEDAERLQKLEGEIRAMKARMGRKQKEESPDDERRTNSSR